MSSKDAAQRIGIPPPPGEGGGGTLYRFIDEGQIPGGLPDRSSDSVTAVRR